jgi:serine protease Do
MTIVSAGMAEQMKKKMPDLGLQLATLTEDARIQYGIDAKMKGVLISNVEKDSEANDLGIVPGDVVTFVRDIPVATYDDVREVVKKTYEEGRPFLAVLIQNKRGARWVSLSLGSAGY